MNQHYDNDQLPVGLLAQLVERCTSITEVMGSNPLQAWIFFRLYFHYCLILELPEVINMEILPKISIHYPVNRYWENSNLSGRVVILINH